MQTNTTSRSTCPRCGHPNKSRGFERKRDAPKGTPGAWYQVYRECACEKVNKPRAIAGTVYVDGVELFRWKRDDD